MKSSNPATRFARLGVGLAVLAGALAWIASPDATPASKDDPTAPPSGPGDISARAATFLALLDADARARATYDLAHEERFNWAFTPVSRNGLPSRT